ncbi:hypothetical protein M011DRAFT_455083 [Sporormia fimetaria CBS 119925]|uniref:Uncharacterized protein n=1 Tax=Sporormia fimetaria CBS 119925 TaxID=1340428 RepID=A0A6A6VQ92_9PLEO|nr:hypothetical protein M011DRAFT_455083 [Sporormia fimetaria CBS 119925]
MTRSTLVSCAHGSHDMLAALRGQTSTSPYAQSLFVVAEAPRHRAVMQVSLTCTRMDAASVNLRSFGVTERQDAVISTAPCCYDSILSSIRSVTGNPTISACAMIIDAALATLMRQDGTWTVVRVHGQGDGNNVDDAHEADFVQLDALRCVFASRRDVSPHRESAAKGMRRLRASVRCGGARGVEACVTAPSMVKVGEQITENKILSG